MCTSLSLKTLISFRVPQHRVKQVASPFHSEVMTSTKKVVFVGKMVMGKTVLLYVSNHQNPFKRFVCRIVHYHLSPTPSTVNFWIDCNGSIGVVVRVHALWMFISSAGKMVLKTLSFTVSKGWIHITLLSLKQNKTLKTFSPQLTVTDAV